MISMLESIDELIPEQHAQAVVIDLSLLILD